MKQAVDGDGFQAEIQTVKAVIPDELLGFAVTVTVGPYPLGSTSHRRAMYAVLSPVTDKARRVVQKMGAREVMAQSPLTAEGAAQIELDPNGRLAEEVGTQTLALAAGLARKHGA